MSQGTSELYANIDGQKYTLIISNYQVSILLLFDRFGKEISFGKIQELTQIPGAELENQINALLNLKLLLCENRNSKDKLQKDDAVSINESFKSSAKRIVCIPAPKMTVVPKVEN